MWDVLVDYGRVKCVGTLEELKKALDSEHTELIATLFSLNIVGSHYKQGNQHQKHCKYHCKCKLCYNGGYMVFLSDGIQCAFHRVSTKWDPICTRPLARFKYNIQYFSLF